MVNDILGDFNSKILSYLPDEDISFVLKAITYAEKAHRGVFRKDGTPYISHPLAVLQRLAELKLDKNTIASAVLHDVIEDTFITQEELLYEFNEKVAELVEGVTKLDQIQTLNIEEKQANNLKKILFAMIKDPRIIIIKLADRLHNMETLGAMKRRSQRRIAKETVEIYIEMAGQLGMYYFKRPLQDLAFKYLYPYRYEILNRKIKLVSKINSEALSLTRAQIEKKLKKRHLDSKVHINSKNISRIYKSMKETQLPFDKVTSGLSYSIVVESVKQCYEVLGIVHELYTPIPGRFKDYVGMAKSNGYQSLHTKVVTEKGFLVEIQILTETMRQKALFGMICCVRKQSNNSEYKHFKAFKWFSNLINIRDLELSSHDFFQQMKYEMAQTKIHVLTPKGDVHELPANATVLDFAFAVHSQVGEHANAGIVNNKNVHLSDVLHNGDVVQIITNQFNNTKPVWLNWVTTSKAKINIKKHLKSHDVIK